MSLVLRDHHRMKDVDSYTLLTGCQILRLSSLEDLIRNVSFQGFLLYLCVTFSTNSSSTSIFPSGQRLFTFLNSTKIYNHLIQTDILTSHRLHSETNSEKSLPSPTCISHRASRPFKSPPRHQVNSLSI